jgi:hypothetical protein
MNLLICNTCLVAIKFVIGSKQIIRNEWELPDGFYHFRERIYLNGQPDLEIQKTYYRYISNLLLYFDEHPLQVFKLLNDCRDFTFADSFGNVSMPAI